MDRVKYNKNLGNYNSLIGIYGKGIIIAYVFALIVFLTMALLITYTDISESIIPPLVSIVMMLSGIISGIYVGMKLKRKGWLHGTLAGLIYVILLIIIGWFFIEDFSIHRYVIYKSILGILAGGIGGMIGVNLK